MGVSGKLFPKLGVFSEFSLFLFVFVDERLMFTFPTFVEKCWTLFDVFYDASFVNKPGHHQAWCAVSVV